MLSGCATEKRTEDVTQLRFDGRELDGCGASASAGSQRTQCGPPTSQQDAVGSRRRNNTHGWHAERVAHALLIQPRSPPTMISLASATSSTHAASAANSAPRAISQRPRSAWRAQQECRVEAVRCGGQCARRRCQPGAAQGRATWSAQGQRAQSSLPKGARPLIWQQRCSAAALSSLERAQRRAQARARARFTSAAATDRCRARRTAAAPQCALHTHSCCWLPAARLSVRDMVRRGAKSRIPALIHSRAIHIDL
jgi:hypothetical protein